MQAVEDIVACLRLGNPQKPMTGFPSTRRGSFRWELKCLTAESQKSCCAVLGDRRHFLLNDLTLAMFSR